jgi:acetyl/propionyl-CoA carboxylase alpha subunit
MPYSITISATAHPLAPYTLLQSCCAAQVRINGENPAKDFQPCPGILGEVKFPTELDGVRVDSWVEAGTEISPFYDSLLAKLMVFAPTRELAVKKIKEAIAGAQRLLHCRVTLHAGLLLSMQQTACSSSSTVGSTRL